MVSPMTRETLREEFYPARQRNSEVNRFREARSQELLKFAAEASAMQPQMASVALERATEYLEVLGPEKMTSLTREATRLWQQSGRQVPQALRVNDPAASASASGFFRSIAQSWAFALRIPF